MQETINEKQKPFLDLFQSTVTKDGKEKLKKVGVIWKNKGKSGDYYTVQITSLRLVGFTPKPKA